MALRLAAWSWFGDALVKAVVFLGLACAPALGRTWVASPDGSSGDGLLAEIIPVYADGDSIECLPGEHVWDQQDAPLERSVTIFGVSSGEVRVTGEWFAFRDCDFLVVEDLALVRIVSGGGTHGVKRVTIRGVELAETPVRLAITFGEIGILDGCTIRDNVADVLGGIAFGRMDWVEVTDCVFLRNQSEVGSPYDECACGGGALLIDSGTNAVIRGCAFVGNTGNAGCAMYQGVETGDLLFEENVVVGNIDQTAAVVVNGSGESQIIRNNIFADNVGFGLWCGEWTRDFFRVYCNVFWQNRGFGGDGARDQNNWYGLFSARGFEGNSDFYSRVVDPQFCPEDSYGLAKESPLWLLTEPCTAVPGTGKGCGVDPVVRMSWGQMKSLFGR